MQRVAHHGVADGFFLANERGRSMNGGSTNEPVEKLAKVAVAVRPFGFMRIKETLV